jgi:putative ABC transport system ATP-binding protein
MKLLKICNKKYNQTIVVVTHDEKVAQMCDRIIYIEDGRLRESI